MFVVAGVTGQTGAAVAQTLLDRGQPVRVLVRNEQKAAEWKNKGAELCVAELSDPLALAEALDGARGAYLLVPPCYGSEDPNAEACAVVDAYVGALERSPVAELVLLSSIGAQHSDKTGPIIPCYYAEQQLAQLTETHVTCLRSAYFMENFANFMAAVKGQGVLPVLFSAARKIAMVSVQDIGRLTGDILIEGTRAHQVLEVSGPTEQSFDEVAALFAQALGSPVKAVQVPESKIVATLTSIGMPPSTAVLYREMALAVEAGLVAFERGPVRQVRGTARIEDTVRRLSS